MEALNQKERNEAFIKFLVLFVLTVAVILFAVYFDFKVPAKENEVLRNRNQQLATQVTQQEAILGLMDSTKALLDKINLPDQNQSVILLDTKISELIIALEKTSSDTSVSGKIVKNVTATYKDLQVNKKNLRDLAQSAQKMQELQSQLDKSNAELRDTKKDLDMLRMLPPR